MSLHIHEETVSALADYAKVPQALTVRERFVVRPIRDGLGGLALEPRPVEPPYLKDYDRDDGVGPLGWLRQWDIAHWGLLSAVEGSSRVGGAVIAWDTPELNMLDGRKDLAVLWDIRVHEDHWRRGIGTALFSAAVDWARRKGCTSLKVETQNINVPACRFYARQGCRLAAIDPFAYRDLPDEVRLIWLKEL
jgi:GNAT superfamily N-acetyltransferase